MIRFLGKIPEECIVAFSGGVDSVAVATFFLQGKKKIKLAFFNHETENSQLAKRFVEEFSSKLNVELIVGKISREKSPKESHEEFWRNERYKFLDSLNSTVITAHHLNDAAETWVFNSLHGKPRVIPYRRKNVIRPFLITPKSEFKSWCLKKNFFWCEDSSNKDCSFARNQIRNKIMPEALKVNPGLLKTIKKMYIAHQNNDF